MNGRVATRYFAAPDLLKEPERLRPCRDPACPERKGRPCQPAGCWDVNCSVQRRLAAEAAPPAERWGDGRRFGDRTPERERPSEPGAPPNTYKWHSRYRGVTRAGRSWLAQFKCAGMFLRKTFRCEVDAARQYNAWALQYRGRAARLNVIPEEDGVGDETA